MLFSSFIFKSLLLILLHLSLSRSNLLSYENIQKLTLGNHSNDFTKCVTQIIFSSNKSIELFTPTHTEICHFLENVQIGRKYKLAFGINYYIPFYQHQQSLLLNITFNNQYRIQNMKKNIYNQEYFFYSFFSQLQMTQICFTFYAKGESLTLSFSQLGVNGVLIEEEQYLVVQVEWILNVTNEDKFQVQILTNFSQYQQSQTFLTNIDFYQNNLSILQNINVKSQNPFTLSIQTNYLINQSSSNIILYFPNYQLKNSATNKWINFQLHRKIIQQQKQQSSVQKQEKQFEKQQEKQLKKYKNIDVICKLKVSPFLFSTLLVQTNLLKHEQWEHNSLLNNGVMQIGGRVIQKSRIQQRIFQNPQQNFQYYYQFVIKMDKNGVQGEKLTIQIIPESIKNQNLEYLAFNFSVLNTIPKLIYLTQKQAQVGKIAIQSSQKLGKMTAFGSKAWNLLFANYFIKSLISYSQLTLFCIFCPFQHFLEPVRTTMYTIFQQIDSQGFQTMLLSHVIKFYKEKTQFTNFLNKQFPTQIEEYRWFGYFEWNQNIFSSIWEEIVILLFFWFKMLLVKALSCLPFSRLSIICRKILKIKRKLFLFELIMVLPKLSLIFGSLTNIVLIHGFFTFKFKINFFFLVFFLFLTLLSVFLNFLEEIYQLNTEKKQQNYLHQTIQTKNSLNDFIENGQKQQKQQKTKISIKVVPFFYLEEKSVQHTAKVKIRKQKLTKKHKTHFLHLLDNLMFFSIPFTAVMFNLLIFMTFLIFITLSRFILLIFLQRKSSFSTFQFIKQLSNKLLWIIYTLLIAIIVISQSNQVIKRCVILLLSVICLGILIQIFSLFIELVFQIKSMISQLWVQYYLKKENKQRSEKNMGCCELKNQSNSKKQELSSFHSISKKQKLFTKRTMASKRQIKNNGLEKIHNQIKKSRGKIKTAKNFKLNSNKDLIETYIIGNHF